MKAEMTRQAEQYIRQVRNRKRVDSIVAVLSVLVALITTYVLMLPGITMEHDVLCGLQEHTHTEACYEAQLTCTQTEGEVVTETAVLSCGFAAHEHTAQCKNSAGELVCGKSTDYYHSHSDACYDAQQNLICSLEENPLHKHNRSCYSEVSSLVCTLEESEGHVHTEACNGQVPADAPDCGLEENEGHTHTDVCITAQLTCTLEENEGHTHDASCIRTENELTCGIAEGEGAHSHGDSCYTPETTLTCETAEGEGAHSHGDSCYTPETTLTCQTAEGEGAHSHGDSCYTPETTLTCQTAEGEGAHSHGEGCYTPETTLTCQTAEGEGAHTHSAKCFPEEAVPTCGDEDHEHTGACYTEDPICETAESEGHKHSDGCYTTENKLTCETAESEGHKHSDGCYTTENKLTCEIAESEGHKHSDSCYTTENKLTCGTAESEGHKHGDSCYTTENKLTCEVTETAGHVHTEACYTARETIICGLEAGAGAHAHGEDCYTDAVTCGMEEGEGAHTHSESCYPLVDGIACGLTEGEGAHTHEEACFTLTEELTCALLHTHTDACFEKDATGKECCICGMEEIPEHRHSDECRHVTVTTDAGHTHTEECYTTAVICGMEEHTHAGTCYPDATATPEVTVDPEVTPDPEATATPEVTVDPETTPDPDATATPEVTADPETTPDPEATATPEVTVDPEVTPDPEATATPEVTVDPEVTPDPEATATPEVTVDPETTPDPEATATPEVTVTPEPTPEPTPDPTYCGIPEHRHSADCLSETGELICGYTEDHLHGELCYAQLTDPVFYCGMEEHLHGYLCFDESLNLVCGHADEHRHSFECLEDPDAVTYYCGMEEHFHDDLCLDENWNLICTLPVHEHSEDCRYACGIPAHTHSNTPSGGTMLLSLEEDFGCFDADGNLICTLQEHTHTEACATAADTGDDDQMLLANGDATDFGNYVLDVDVHTDGKYDDYYKPTYDPTTDSYSTSIDIKFSIPNNVLTQNQVYNFTYDLPADVGVTSSSTYDDVYDILNANGVKVGEFQIKRNGDGSHYLDIHLDPDKVNTTTDCTGTLYFKCSIDGDATRDDGSIYVEFEQNIGFEVGGSDINRDEGETALYSVSTEKSPANGSSAYDPATNTLSYQVKVKTKGTPDVINLVDNINVNGLTIESQQITSVQLTNNGVTTNVSNYTSTVNGNNMNITLPKVDPASVPDGQVAEYLINYQVKLADAGYANTYLNAQNSIQANSAPGTPNEVKDSTSINENHDLKMLEKTGSFDANAGVINWKVVFNQANKNISGLTLNDQMLGSLPDASSLSITPNDGGYAIQYNPDGSISGIHFQNYTTSTYTITYQTKPGKDYAGNYAEANKVTVVNPNGDTVVEDDYTVHGVNRNQNVSKSVAGTTENSTGMTIDWKVEIPIDEDGLSNDVDVSDNMSPNGRHYMTREQLQALYSQLGNLLAKDDSGKPIMKVQVITGGANGSGNYQTTEMNIEDALAQADGSTLFGSFSFTLGHNASGIANLKNTTLTLTYSSTAYTEGLTNNSQFTNWVGVGNSTGQAGVNFVADNTNPVTKLCGHDGSHNGECNYSHQNDPFSWDINVYQNDDYDYIRVEDTLPEGVELVNVQLGQNLQTRLQYDASAAPDGSGFYPLTLTPNGDTNGLAIVGKYNPSTRQIVVDVRPDTDPNTQIYDNFGSGKTLKLRVSGTIPKDKRPAPGETKEYELPNTANVYVGKNNADTPYDDDSHTLKVKYTTPNLVTKKDMNWQENDSVIQNYNENNFGWIVEVRQDQEYDQLVITDTLPQGPILSKISVGSSEIKVVRAEDGTVTLTPHINYEEEGLLIVPSYDAGSGRVTIVVKRNPDSDLKNDPARTKGYGEDQTLTVRYYCTLPEDHLATEENPSVSNQYKNTASVDFTKDNNTTTGTDDQTITTQFTYNPPVKKFGVGSDNQESQGDVVVKNDSGKLMWKVKISKADTYDYVIIEDQLPAGMVELDPTRGEGVIQLKQYSGYWLRLGESTDGGITYPLVAYNQHNQNEVLYGYEATFNAQTGKIYIKLDRDPWQRNGVLENETVLIFYCRVTEDYMPNVEDGQYKKELGEVTNNVDVSTNEGHLGHDGQTQIVTVEQTRPQFTVVDKNSPVFDGSKTLHYVVDINPEQQDMDPAKNQVTIVDVASYSQSQPYADSMWGPTPANRRMTLLQDSVKLYYADYDENGQPLKENGKLVPGEPVDPSLWNMVYTEDDSNDTATRTITLSVPDSRALVLVYDYEVTLNSFSEGHNNVPLDIDNRIYAEGFENQASSSETSSQDVWNASGGGGFIVVNDLVKFDSANESHMLEGVTFELQQYVDGAWSLVKEMTTDADGRIQIPSVRGFGTGELEYNILYRLVETKPIIGYQLPDPVPSYTFYWPWNNGWGGPDVEVPSGFDLADADDLTWGGVTYSAPNTKLSTSLSVEKLWLDPDGSKMSERDMPSSVTVELHRYAVPDDVWTQLVADTNGGINGAMAGGVTNTVVDIQIRGRLAQLQSRDLAVQIEAQVGSTLAFDVCVISGGVETSQDAWGHVPTFQGYTHTSKRVENGQEWYHYEVPVTDGMSLIGSFPNSNNEWGDSNGDWNGLDQRIMITNVEATRGLPADNSVYNAQLAPYVDRSYAVSTKLTSAGDWKSLWENLPLEGEDENGNKVHYKYYVTETPPSGYAVKITGYSSDNGGEFVVENQKDGSRSETMNLRVKKRWFGAHGEEFVYDKTTGIWTDSDNRQYVYENGVWYIVDGDTRTQITDQAQLGTMPLPSVSIRLLRKDLLAGEDAPWETYIYNQNAATVINANTNWTYNFTNLPTKMYNAVGQLLESYDYFIEEVIDGDYIVELVPSGSEVDANGKKYEVITVKNSAVRNIAVDVEKQWAEGSLPEGDANVTVVLGRQIYTENGYVPDASFAAEAQQKGWQTQITLNAGNEWKHQWTGLPNGVIEDDGTTKSYSYTVTETMVNGKDVDSTIYEPTYEYGTDGSVTITNTKVIPKTELIAEKVWKDENGSVASAPNHVPSITLKLMRRAGENGAAEFVEELVLNAGNRWKLVVSELEKFVPVNGEPSETPYIYYVVEEPVPSGYAVSYSNSADGVSFAAPENGQITVTNRIVTDLTVTKLWQNTKGENVPAARDAVYVKLFKDGSEYDLSQLSGLALQDGYIKLSAQNSWNVIVPELPEGTYSVKEYLYENGTYTEVTGAAISPATGNADANFTITNTLTGVELEKKWQNADGTAYTPEADTEAVFKLMRRSSWGGEDTEVEQITLNGSETTPWTYAAQNLPLNGPSGETYSYYFVETSLSEEFGVAYSNSQDGSAFTDVNDETITVTNTKHTQLKVEKKWANEADATTEVQFELYQVKTPIGGSGSGSGNTGSGETATDVTYTFNIVYHQVNTETGLDQYVTLESTQRTFKSNQNIVWKPSYNHDATNWGNYRPSGSPNTITSDKGESFTFNESSSSAKPFVYSFDLGLAGTENKTITWETNNWFWGNRFYNSDGMDGDFYVLDNWSHSFETTTAQSYAARAATGGTVVGSYTLNAENDWSITFTEEDLKLLPDSQYTYTYYVREAAMDGYTVVYDNNEGVASGVITMTNEKDQPDVVVDTPTTLTLAKQWVNADGCMPQSLTFTLTQKDALNSEDAGTQHTVTVDLSQTPPTASCATLTDPVTLNVTAGSDGGFTLTVENLPDTRTVNGTATQDYTYTAAEQPVPGFTSSVSGDEQQGFTFVNTATELKVEKKWGEGAQQQTMQFKLWRKTVQSGGTEPDPGETTVTCPGCQQQITEGDPAHAAAACGISGHYVCSGNHGTASCGQSGHYACDGQDHSNCGGGSTAYTCQNCGNPMTTATDHDANCGIAGHYNCDGKDHGIADCQTAGHYKCDGNAHGWCSVCNQTYQCNGSHGAGICDGTSGGEQPSDTVDITFVATNVYSENNQNVNDEETHTETGIPVGATVTWQLDVDYNYNNNPGWSPAWQPKFTYDGTEYTANVTYDNTNGHAVYTVSFPASVSGTVTLAVNPGSVWQKADMVHTISYTEASAASQKSLRIAARSGSASETVDTAGATDLGTYDLSEANGWQQLIHGLPMTDEAGNAYLYFVEEIGAEGYIVSYTNNGGIAPDTGNAITITNDKTADVVTSTTTRVQLTKVWQNASDYKPESLTFTLTGQDAVGSAAAQEHTITVDLTKTPPVPACDTLTDPVTLAVTPATDGTDSWTLTIDGLPDTTTVNGSTTTDHTYTITEQPVEGFTSTVSGDEQNGFTATNTRNTLSAAVEKQWGEGTPEAKPAVTMTLCRYLEKDGVRLEETVTIDGLTNPVILTGSEETPWNHQWKDLPAYGSITGEVNGAETTLTGEYVYYVSETPVEGYTSAATPADGTLENGKVIFLNTPTQLKVEKQWGAGAQQQTMQFKLWRRSTAVGQPDEPDQPELVTCPGCGVQITEGETGHEAAACGTNGHTVCDGKNHSAAPCGEEGHYVCDGLDHSGCGIVTITCPGCGVQITQGDSGHAAASCGVEGHYVCDHKDHSAASCGNAGHTVCDGNDHSQASCGTAGHTNCDGSSHAAAACGVSGHYACDGSDHSWCSFCNNGYQCNGSHGDGVCNSTSGGEQPSDTVDITFVATNHYSLNGQPYTDQETDAKTSIPAGATVTWQLDVDYSNNTKSWAPVWEPKFSYNGTQYTARTTTDYNNGHTVYTVSFPASVSGTVELVVSYDSGWQPATMVHTISYAEAAAASAKTLRTVTLRTGSASETVDTAGATELGTYSLSSGNNWQQIFYALPAASADGSEVYTYFVEEIGADGYIVSYENNGGIAPGEGSSIIIRNNKPDDVIVDTTTALTLTKQWAGAADYRPDTLIFRLTQLDVLSDGATPAEHVITVDLTKTPPAAACGTLSDPVALTVTPATDGTDSWTLTVNGLPDTRTVNGVPTIDYTYAITEDAAPGYTAAVTGDEQNGFTVTNTRDTLAASVQKEWAEGTPEGKPPVILTLYRYVADENNNMGVQVELDGIENPVMLDGTEPNPWHYTWENLPAYGRHSYTLDGTETTLTGEYTYYVVETPVDGYFSTSAPDGGMLDADGNVVITNTPTSLKVEKRWEGYPEAEVSGYTVYLQLKNAAGDTLDPTRYGTGKSAVALNGFENCFEAAWGETVTFRGLPAGEYTVTEVGYRIGDGVPQMNGDGSTLDWKVTDGTATLTGSALDGEVTATVTNTKRTQLKVEKEWIGSTARKTMQFRLWSRVEGGSAEPAITCPACQQPITEGQTHAAGCGHADHYTCQGGDHSPCTYCNSGYVCEDGHGDGVCNAPAQITCPHCGDTTTEGNAAHGAADCGTEGHYACVGEHGVCDTCKNRLCNGENHSDCPTCGQPLCNGADHTTCGGTEAEMVTVTIKMVKSTDEGTYDLISWSDTFSAGTHVRWSGNWKNVWWSPTVDNVTADNGTVSATREQVENSHAVYTIDCGVVQTDTVVTWVTDNNYTGEWSTTAFGASSSYGLRTAAAATNASETVNTAGANDLGTYTLSEENGWQQILYDLPAVDENGNTILYFVEELDAGDYVVSYGNNAGISPDGGTIVIRNDTPVIPTVELTVNKTWLDASGAPADAPNYAVHYEVWAVGGQEAVLTGVLNRDNEWTATHTGLDASGTYYVVETSVENGNITMQHLYDTTYQVPGGEAQTDPAQAAVGGGTVTITNRLKPTFTLPETGGVGTHLYTGAGVLLIGIALTLLYKGNKGKRRADA